MVIYLLVVSICIALISRVFWQQNICIFNILEFNTVISENAFSWHPKSEKWFCQGLVHTFPKDSCPSGTRPMEMYELVLGKTHFSDFGCQEKIHFSSVTQQLGTPFFIISIVQSKVEGDAKKNWTHIWGLTSRKITPIKILHCKWSKAFFKSFKMRYCMSLYHLYFWR